MRGNEKNDPPHPASSADGQQESNAEGCHRLPSHHGAVQPGHSIRRSVSSTPAMDHPWFHMGGHGATVVGPGMEGVRLRRIFLPHPLIDVRHFHSICMQILWESRATVVWPAAWPLLVLHHPKRPAGAPAGPPSSRHAVESRALQAKLSPVVDATDQAYARLAPQRAAQSALYMPTPPRQLHGQPRKGLGRSRCVGQTRPNSDAQINTRGRAAVRLARSAPPQPRLRSTRVIPSRQADPFGSTHLDRIRDLN